MKEQAQHGRHTQINVTFLRRRTEVAIFLVVNTHKIKTLHSEFPKLG